MHKKATIFLVCFFVCLVQVSSASAKFYSVSKASSGSWQKTRNFKYDNSFDCPVKYFRVNYNSKSGNAEFDLGFWPNHCTDPFSVTSNELNLGLDTTCQRPEAYSSIFGVITVDLQDMTQFQPLDQSDSGIDQVSDKKYGLDSTLKFSMQSTGLTDYKYFLSGSQLRNRNLTCASFRTHGNIDQVTRDDFCNCWTTGDFSLNWADLRK